MNLDEMRSTTKVMLSPKDISGVLHCDPYALNTRAKNGGSFPFPFIYNGRTLKFPRVGFLNWYDGVNQNQNQKKKQQQQNTVAIDADLTDSEILQIRDYINYVISKR